MGGRDGPLPLIRTQARWAAETTGRVPCAGIDIGIQIHCTERHLARGPVRYGRASLPVAAVSGAGDANGVIAPASAIGAVSAMSSDAGTVSAGSGRAIANTLLMAPGKAPRTSSSERPPYPVNVSE